MRRLLVSILGSTRSSVRPSQRIEARCLRRTWLRQSSRRLLENGQPTIPIAEHTNVEAAEVESSRCLEFLVSHLVLVVSRALRAGSMESVKGLGPPLCLPCESPAHSLQACPVAYSPFPRLFLVRCLHVKDVCLTRPYLDSLEEFGYLGVGIGLASFGDASYVFLRYRMLCRMLSLSVRFAGVSGVPCVHVV